MAASRWDEIEEIFGNALPLTAPEREEYIARACGADRILRADIEAMIAASEPDRALTIERLAPDDREPSPAPDPIVGTELGRWRVVRLLGRGGMGNVYLAERADGQYQQNVALKVVSPGSWGPGAAERFQNERHALARLAHPNIARLFDGGFAADGRPYFVMELVDGAPITEWCDQRRLSIEERLRLFCVVCRAVQHAHGALVVHRDLKPANTFVSSQGEVKLLDFGIAKLLDSPGFSADAPATRAPSTAFTPEYAAPEQIVGGPVTTASDVYSLGVLLYELLTGVRPLALDGKTPAEMEREIASATIRPPSERVSTRHGDDLDCIVLTALRAQPELRYESAGQLGEEIARFLDGRPVLARPDRLAYRTSRFIGRNRAAVLGAALVAASLAGFGVVAGWQEHRAAAERDAARTERDKAEKVVGVLVDFFETSNPNLHPGGDDLSVRQFLVDAQPRVLERLQTQPVVAARMQQVFGLIHAARDQYAEAETALEQALAAERRLLGPDHPEAIDSLYHLGRLYEHKGQTERARALFAEALERSRRVFGEDHEVTARSLAALASPTRVDEGSSFLRRALEIRGRVLPPDHPDIAENRAQLAHFHALRGDESEARRLYAQTLATFRTPAARRHPTAIRIMGDFAELLNQLDEYAEAEVLLRESLELARAAFGSDSSVVADRLNGLAVNLAIQGHHVEAERIFRESYGLHAALFGEDHWRTSNVARNVGALIALQERYAEALPWLDKAIGTLRRGSPYAASQLLLSLEGRRATILLHLGRGEEAVRALESAAAALEAMRNVDARSVQIDLWMFHAMALIETGRPAESEAPARQALAALDHLGAQHPKRAGAECLLGWSLVLTDRREAGQATLARCLPLYRGWGLADPTMVAHIDRLMAGGSPE
jgi:eukaryotic-like serine/threonine-protein kinase